MPLPVSCDCRPAVGQTACRVGPTARDTRREMTLELHVRRERGWPRARTRSGRTPSIALAARPSGTRPPQACTVRSVRLELSPSAGGHFPALTLRMCAPTRVSRLPPLGRVIPTLGSGTRDTARAPRPAGYALRPARRALAHQDAIPLARPEARSGWTTRPLTDGRLRAVARTCAVWTVHASSTVFDRFRWSTDTRTGTRCGLAEQTVNHRDPSPGASARRRMRRRSRSAARTRARNHQR
jgi:hypothetical protein